MITSDTTSPSDILLAETRSRVLTLTLNRPQKRNALSVALRTALITALAGAESDGEIDVVVLTGADPVFCAGLDLNEPRPNAPSNGYARPRATTSPPTAKRSFVAAPTQTTT
jgi:enoyl-CoA hydratase/carnithine racemase